jgi:hypothetical protein
MIDHRATSRAAAAPAAPLTKAAIAAMAISLTQTPEAMGCQQRGARY